MLVFISDIHNRFPSRRFREAAEPALRSRLACLPYHLVDRAIPPHQPVDPRRHVQGVLQRLPAIGETLDRLTADHVNPRGLIGQTADQMRMTRLSRLLRRDRFPHPVDAVFFTDLDKLLVLGAQRIHDLADRLGRRYPEARIFNPPAGFLDRYRLLKKLHELGWNQSDVYRAQPGVRPKRFPVFVRHEHDHDRPQTALLPDQAALDAYLAGPRNKKVDRAHQIVVEFCDTRGTDGLYRKYSSIILGRQIIPRHLLFSEHWYVKTPKLEHTDARRAEEWDYLRTNPHEREIRRLAEIAGVTFGRIDYSLLDGRLQTWEINSNPVTLTRRNLADPDRGDMAQWVLERYQAALWRIQRGEPDPDPSAAADADALPQPQTA